LKHRSSFGNRARSPQISQTPAGVSGLALIGAFPRLSARPATGAAP
jgi:hypothetical protein